MSSALRLEHHCATREELIPVKAGDGVLSFSFPSKPQYQEDTINGEIPEVTRIVRDDDEVFGYGGR